MGGTVADEETTAVETATPGRTQAMGVPGHRDCQVKEVRTPALEVLFPVVPAAVRAEVAVVVELAAAAVVAAAAVEKEASLERRQWRRWNRWRIGRWRRRWWKWRSRWWR